MTLAEALLNWYDQEKRDLPWRSDRDPYKVWVSEIMLQQTRVEAVIPYFERFIARFPTVESLAAAEEEEVLTYWQGLGYYSRARNLHKGVREVQSIYGGFVPADHKKIKSLAGVGDYTAGAIASIAFNQDYPAVDGNVLRVFSRLYASGDDITTTAAKRKITALVTTQLPPGQAGEFNQALMDLGARVCIPGNPRCENCPLSFTCQAFKLRRVKEFPVKRPKKQPRPVYVTVGVIERQGDFLVEQRPAKGLLAGMWQFPVCEEAEQTDKSVLVKRLNKGGLVINDLHFFYGLTHTFSHIRWFMEVYQGQANHVDPDYGGLWVSRDDLGKMTWAGPHGKIAQTIIDRKIPTD